MRLFLLVLGGFLLWTFNPSVVLAQSNQSISIGVANNVPIEGKDIKDGDIVSFTDKGYFKSSKAYDSAVVGVVATKPAVSLNIENGSSNNFPVVTTGNVEVNVSTINGKIKAGDIITTSEIEGVGMKSTKSGYILGTAIAGYDASDPQAIGKIPVSLNLHYAASNTKVPSSLGDIFSLSVLATYESPSAVFKYLVAGFVVVLSCVLAFVSFGRTANTGVEALGRNPLAGKMIQFGIIFNVVITIAILAAGVGVAIVIVRL